MTRDCSDEFQHELEERKRASTIQLLFRAGRLINERALERVNQGRPLGQYFRPAHTSLLPHIDLEGTRLTTLAERLGVSKQAVGQLVSELEDYGMLERLPDPSDGRAKLVSFTAQGRSWLLQGLALLGELEAEVATQIGKQRLAELHTTLTRLMTWLEPDNA